MMVKNLNFLKIGSIDYKLLFHDNYARDFNMLGSHCGNSLEIIIDNGLVEERTEKTILHECLEAINFEYELNLEHYKLTVLETALYSLIKDNRELFLKILNDEVGVKNG